METTRRAWLKQAGHTDGKIQRALRDGELVRLAHGIYADAQLSGRAELHRALMAAHADRVFGLESAALLHGIALESVPSHVETVVDGRPNVWRRSSRVVRSFPMAEGDVVMVDGFRATSLARTVADLARLRTPLGGLVPWESALWRARVESGLEQLQQSIDDSLDRCARLKGAQQAAQLAQLAGAWSQSAKETESKLVMVGLGLPAPVQQFEVYDHDGGLIGVSDFAWPDRGVLGEYDGKDKYDLLARPGESPRDVMLREKRRQQRMELRGWVFARWDQLVLARPAELRRVITSAFEIAAGRRRPAA